MFKIQNKLVKTLNMARLSSEIKTNVNNLTEQLLDIIDEAKKVEFLLLERFGENDTTIIVLDELTEIAQQAIIDLCSQLTTLRIRIAEAQPIITPDMLRLLTERMAIVENRIPALERSTQEIKLDWEIS
jgi:hypothetical protein